MKTPYTTARQVECSRANSHLHRTRKTYSNILRQCLKHSKTMFLYIPCLRPSRYKYPKSSLAINPALRTSTSSNVHTKDVNRYRCLELVLPIPRIHIRQHHRPSIELQPSIHLPSLGPETQAQTVDTAPDCAFRRHIRHEHEKATHMAASLHRRGYCWSSQQY